MFPARPLLAVVVLGALLATAAGAKPKPRPSKPLPAAPPSRPAAAEDHPRPLPPVTPGPRRIGIADVVAGPGVAPQAAASFAQGLEDELRQREGVVVVPPPQARDELGLERQRQLLGAEPTLNPDPLGLLKLDELVVTRMTLAGATLELDVRRIDGRSGEVVGRRQLQVSRDDPGELSRSPSALTAALFPELAKVTTSPRAQNAPLRVVVLEVRSVGDVPTRALAALNQAIAPELRKLVGVSAISSSEVTDMLSLERQKQLIGCSDDSVSCFAEIAGALDADEMITLDLTLVGRTYALTSRRIDLRRSRVAQTRLEQFEKRDGEELLTVIGPVIEALYPDRALKPGRQRGVEATVIRRLNPPPIPRWVFFTTGGLGVATGLVGGAAALLMRASQAEFNTLAHSSESSPVSASSLTAREAEARRWALVANTLFASAGALAVAALVEAFFTDWRDDRAAFSVQPIVSSKGGGVGFTLSLGLP